MPRSIFSLLLLAAMCAVAQPPSHDDLWDEPQTVAERVNVRSQRSVDAEIVRVLNVGEKIRLALYSDGWFAVFSPDEIEALESRALGYVSAAAVGGKPALVPPETDAISKKETLSGEVGAFKSKPEVLLGLVKAIEQHRSELDVARARLDQAVSPAERAAINTEIRHHESDISRLQSRFQEAAAGVDLGSLGGEVADTFELSEEIKELLSPLIQEIKRATSQPREIDRLGREEGNLLEQLREANAARENVKSIHTKVVHPLLLAELNQFDHSLEAEATRIASELDLTRGHLQDLRERQAPLGESFRRLTQLFYRSRGRNLLLAHGALILSILLLRGLHQVIRRYSPLHRRRRRMYVRVFDLIFGAGTVVFGVLAFISVLYAAGDWVLLTLVSLFLFGIAWASKTALPHFWQQAMLLLNLGPVREHERLVYNGVAWRVQTLGLYTVLANPALQGGRLRLPIRELANLHSRPFEEHEPWFPTRLDDWILLADGTHGKVVTQTPEVVTLVQLGGARRSYPAAEFVTLAPTVLSTGFRLRVVFGIDYQHQRISTTEIPATLKNTVRSGLSTLGFKENQSRVRAEFKAAGASSLDIEVVVDLDGALAPRYFEIGRAVQRLCVDTCNTKGWVIPFTQVTLHMAGNTKAPPSASSDLGQPA